MVPQRLMLTAALVLAAQGKKPLDLPFLPRPVADAPLFWTPLGEPGCGGAMTDLSVSPHDPKRVLVAGDMLGVGLSVDGAQNWRTSVTPGVYECASFTWHPKNPKVVWCGSMSGPLLSTDAGATWTLMRGGFPPVSEGEYSAPVEEVLFDPADPTRLLASGGSSRRWSSPGSPRWGWVWESRDGGKTWTHLATVGPDGSVTPDDGSRGVNLVSMRFFAGSSTELIATGSGAGVYRSSDGGKTWRRAGGGLPTKAVEKIVVHPTAPNVVWLSMGNEPGPDGKLVPGGVYVSRDRGETFSPSSNGLSQAVTPGDGNLTARYGFLAVAPKDPRRMWVSDTAWNTGVIYRSDDGGANWTPVATKGNIGQSDHGVTAFRVETAMPAGLGAGRMTADPANPDVAYGINSEWIVRTGDGGATWEDRSSKKAANGGWTGRGYSGWCSRQVRFDPYRKGRAIVQAMDAGRAWLSEDGLSTWRYGAGFDMPWGCGADLAWTRGDRVYAAYGQGNFQGLGVSEDGGRTWRVTSGAASGLPEMYAGGAEPSAVAADPGKPLRAWAALGGQLYATEDGGRVWKKPLPGVAVNGLAFSGRSLFAAGRDGVAVDDGGGFRPLGGPKEARQCTTDAEGRLYVVAKGERPGVWRFDGATWVRLLDEGWASSVAVDPKDANRLIVTTAKDPYSDLFPGVGVLVSGDGGKRWGVANDGLAMRRGSCAGFDPFSDAVVFGAYGRGFWRASWPAGFVPKGDRTYAPSPEDAVYARPSPWGLTKGLSLRNPSFSDGSASPDGWDQRWTGREKITVSRDATTYRSAPAALRVDANGNGQGQAGQIVEAGAGTRFTLRAWLKTKGRVKVNVAVQPMNEGWTPISFLQVGYAQNDTEWTKVEREIELPAGTARFNVVLLVEGDGSAWLDDVNLLPVGGSK